MAHSPETSLQRQIAGSHVPILRHRPTLIFSAWSALVIAVSLTYLFAAAVFHPQLKTMCSGQSCLPWQRSSTEALSASLYANAQIAREAVVILGFIAIAGVMIRRAREDRTAVLGAFALVGFAGFVYPDGITALAWSQPGWDITLRALGFISSVAFLAFVYTFPDGQFVPGWSRWVFASSIPVCAIAYGSPRASFFHYFGDAYFFAVVAYILVAIAAMSIRYRRFATATQRQQIKWVLLGLGSSFVGFLITAMLLPVFGSDLTSDGRVLPILGMTLVVLFFLLIPASISLAMIRYRLWNVDFLINRALVFGGLTSLIAFCYVMIVAGLGAMAVGRSGLLLPFLASGLVAIAIQPARNRLQLGVNRMMYGERDDPYAVLSKLGRQLEGAGAGAEIVPAIERTLIETLKLPYAEIVPVGHSTSSSAPGGTLRFPLSYQLESVGELVVAPRSAGEAFSPAEQRLITDLSNQIGIALHAVRLRADLQKSRERIVTAREEERRRLRRDLHDGLGPLLSGFTLQIDVASELVASNPDEAQALLRRLKHECQRAVADIRRLVYALRPPALDDLGLLGAVREEIDRFHGGKPVFALDLPEALPPLTAAVEVAAYRIVQEAIANVIRHAHAVRAEVSIKVDTQTEELVIEVSDDGQGLPNSPRAGVGFVSMRERAEELGGTFEIASAPAGGVFVVARLPVQSDTTARGDLR